MCTQISDLLPPTALTACRPSIVKNIIVAATSPGAAAHAITSLRLLHTLSSFSPSAPCPFSSMIFYRALSFILSTPGSLQVALNHLSSTLSLPLPPVCSSVSLLVSAVVAAEALAPSLPPPNDSAAAAPHHAALSSALSRLLLHPPNSPLITVSLFVSSLSRALSDQCHSSFFTCTSRVCASLASALQSRDLLRVACVRGAVCAHTRSLCRGVCEWALTMRVSANTAARTHQICTESP